MWATQFPDREPSRYVFPSEKCGAKGEENTFGFTSGVVFYDTDPTKPIGDWKEAWEKARVRAAAILKGDRGEPKEVPQKAKSAKAIPQLDDTSIQLKPESLKCRFHDLRHTAVTRLLEGGIPYPVVAAMMGWSAATAIRMASATAISGVTLCVKQQMFSAEPKFP